MIGDFIAFLIGSPFYALFIGAGLWLVLFILHPIGVWSVELTWPSVWKFLVVGYAVMALVGVITLFASRNPGPLLGTGLSFALLYKLARTRGWV
jgi:hypothetical protein